MSDINLKDKELWQEVKIDNKTSDNIDRKSLSFSQDVWRRLKQNKIAIISLVVIIFILLGAIFLPMFWHTEYSDQNLDFANIPNKLHLYELEDGTTFYVTSDYNVLEVTKDGVLQKMATLKNADLMNRKKIFTIGENKIEVDYSKYFEAKKELNQLQIQAASDKSINIEEKEHEIQNMTKFTVTCNEKELKPSIKVRNKTYIFGNDSLGRDLFIRVIYGARISLAVGFAAAIICFVVGILYGGISGYIGGKVDNIMMRIVDIISTIPTLLYVILLSVLFDSGGLFTIILTIGLTYWVGMARLVRGQVLSLKEQEFILAAKSLGASTWKILIKHLIPNIMGPVMVSLTMQIPSAIFTEAFLSFIGLGISAPMASWGTLCNDALQGLYTYPYQLMFPAVAISVTILAFNLLGDGLRDALDPKLRK